MSDSKLSCGGTGRNFTFLPLALEILKLDGALHGSTTKLNPLCFRHGDALRLPLPDKLSFRLSHLAEKLKYDVSYQRAGQIFALPGIQ